MRTLTEIKDFVAKDYLYHDYKTALDLFQKGAISETSFNEFIDDVLKEVAKEALKNASRVGDALRENGDLVKQIILNESNIPEL